MRKILLFHFSFCFLILNQLIAQEELHTREITFVNKSQTTGGNRTLYFKVYPVSMVFRGRENLQSPNYYELRARYTEQNRFNYIGGRGKDDIFFEIAPYSGGQQNFIGFNFDNEGLPNDNYAALGIGIYKMEFWWSGHPDTAQPDDTCYIEFDAIHCITTLTICDINIEFWDNNHNPRIEYAWNGCPLQPISSVSRYIKSWDQCFGSSRNKSIDFMIYDNNVPTYFDNKFPFDSRRDCDISGWGYYENHDFNSELSGRLSSFLSLRKDISTPITFWDPNYERYFARNIVILPEALLEIYDNKTLTLSNYTNWINAATMTICSRVGHSRTFNLILKPNAVLDVKTKSTLVLKHWSSTYLFESSKIILRTGSKLCNYGGILSGPGQLIVESGVNNCIPEVPTEYHFKNGTQLILNENAYLEFGANSVVTFDSLAQLIMSPGSSIKFGENSKLIIKDGANIVADNATFTSLNPGETWDGIYLEDVSNDTIRFCTIENAVNGINVIDKTPLLPADNPSTEISNCTFSNTTFNPLTNGIFISNSSNILIRNNNFTSLQDNGFTAGIISQYCPSGNFNIIDNTIDKTQTGITVIQSSPYIARNTITGQAGEGNGIYLDNANGTLEYNTINSFNRSVVSYYSSPYLLKNIFNNPSTKNLELYTSSVPLLRPVNSGSALSWLGGDNKFYGSPSASAIGFIEDSYPEMDSGFNVISMNNGADYMNGNIPPSFPSSMNVTYNYWGETPVQEKFEVTGGEVIY